MRTKEKTAFEKEVANWNAPDNIVTPDHPKFPEYEHIRTNVIDLLQRMTLQLTMPNGEEGFLAAGEKLKDLYVAAENIRSQMATDRIRKDMGVSPTEDYESVIEDRVEKATSDIGMYGEDINELLTKIAVGLGKNAADVRDGDTDGNYFYIEGGKAAGMVDFGKVRKAEKYVQDLLQMDKSLSPNTIALAKDLKIGIQNIRGIDPVRSNGDIAWTTLKDAKGGLSSTPFRVLGVVVGGLITAFGLGRNAWQIWKGESPSINLATFGWAGILLYSLHPDIFQTSPEKAFAELKNDRPEERIAMHGGFKGEKGVKGFTELQDIASDDPSGLNALRKKDAVSVMEIGALAEEKGELMGIMKSMKTDQQRAQALHALGRKLDEREQEINKFLMRDIT